MNENNDPRNMVCFELQNKTKPTTKRKSERPRCPRCRRHDRARDRLRIYAVRPHQPAEKRPRLLRGDVGYGGDENMCEAEKRGLMHLFKIRRTKTVLALLRQYENSREWIDAGEGWEALEVSIRLGGWKKSRRCILLRRPSKDVKRIELASS